MRGHERLGSYDPPRGRVASEVDWPLVPLAGGLAAVLGGVGGWIGGRLSDTDDLGPTAASLSDAFNTTLGAMVGVAAGVAVGALAARRRQRFETGLAAGAVAYLLLIPVIWISSDTDTLSDELLILFAALLCFAAAAGVGSLLGTVLSKLLRRQT